MSLKELDCDKVTKLEDIQNEGKYVDPGGQNNPRDSKLVSCLQTHYKSRLGIEEEYNELEHIIDTHFKEHQDFINLINNFNKHSLPKHPVFGEFSEKKFTYTLDKLEDRYRNAIAHAHNDKKEIDVYLLTGSDESANISLQYSLSSIRFIIKVQINSLNEIFNFVKNKSCEKSLKRKC